MSFFARPHQKVNVDITTHTEVTERRAPTDESVRLLAEMERAAEDKLVAVARVQSTEFSFKAHIFLDDYMCSKRMRVKFTLGGKPFDVTVNIPDGHDLSAERILAELRDELAKQIAGLILQGSFNDLLQLKCFPK